MEVLITSHVKVFLGNKYNSYTHTARKVTYTRNVYEKTNEAEEEKFWDPNLEPTRTSTMKLV